MASAASSRVVSGMHQVGKGVKLAYQVLNGCGKSSTAQCTKRKPVVLVQGLSGVKEDWRHFSKGLAEAGHTVLVFDNRGIGSSVCPRGESFTMQDMADDCLSLVRGLGWSSVNLMGISMGGMIAMTAAVTAPELVHKLVLGCTHFGGEGIERPAPGFQAAFSVEDAKRMGLQKYTERLMAFNYTAKWVEANRSKFERICSDSFKTRRPMSVVGCQALAIAGTHDIGDRLRSLPMPTLVIHGTGDQVVLYGNGVALIEAIPSAGMVALTDVGHVFWDMDGGRSLEVVNEFFAAPAAAL